MCWDSNCVEYTGSALDILKQAVPYEERLLRNAKSELARRKPIADWLALKARDEQEMVARLEREVAQLELGGASVARR